MRLLRSFPGIDYVTAAILLSEIGDIERFDKESSLSYYCGVSPVMWQSGTSKVKTKRRKKYNRRLKGILFFISLSQIRINPESREYYWRKRKEGKSHLQAMNALSRQLIKIIYYMLTNRECYRRVQIPVDSGHPFRFIPATDSGAFRPPVSVDSGHFFPDSGIGFEGGGAG